MHCPNRPTCFDKSGIRRRILAGSCYPAFYRGHQRVGTPEFYSMMRLRKIWAEGSFSVLKREHCISKIRKRGISAAAEECLLAVMALNLKRMVRAIFNKLKIRFMWAEEVFPQPSFSFCQQVPYSTLSTNGFGMSSLSSRPESQRRARSSCAFSFNRRYDLIPYKYPIRSILNHAYRIH